MGQGAGGKCQNIVTRMGQVSSVKTPLSSMDNLVPSTSQNFGEAWYSCCGFF